MGVESLITGRRRASGLMRQAGCPFHPAGWLFHGVSVQIYSVPQAEELHWELTQIRAVGIRGVGDIEVWTNDIRGALQGEIAGPAYHQVRPLLVRTERWARRRNDFAGRKNPRRIGSG